VRYVFRNFGIVRYAFRSTLKGVEVKMDNNFGVVP